jgi:predicted ATPase
LAHLCQVLFYLGYLDQGAARLKQALSEAHQIAGAFSWAVALTQTWCGEWEQSSAEALLRRADQLLAITTEHGFTLYSSLGTIFRGWCLSALGEIEEGIALLNSGLAKHHASGAALYTPFAITLLADAYGRVALPQEGMQRLEEAARLVEMTNERWAEAEMHRIRGTLFVAANDTEAAQASYHQALKIARRQSAKFWELRAALDLARLWCDQGKRIVARDLLASVYGWFTEGLDTPVLQDAKALLDELA